MIAQLGSLRIRTIDRGIADCVGYDFGDKKVSRIRSTGGVRALSF
jgi:hypothetical protein